MLDKFTFLQGLGLLCKFTVLNFSAIFFFVVCGGFLEPAMSLLIQFGGSVLIEN